MSELSRPHGLRAGFHARVEDAASGLRHAGEQWASERFMITRHTHTVWELYLQVHGVTHWRAGPDLFGLRPGDLFAVGPGVAHQMAERPGGAHHFYYAAIDVHGPVGNRHPELTAPWRCAPGVVHRPGAESLAEPFAALMRELTVGPAFAGPGLALAADRIVLEATRLLHPEPAAGRRDIHPVVATARDLLDRHYMHRWTLDDLADRLGLAPTYLAGLFAREVGLSPHVYLNERRIERAKQLLATSDLPITAIATDVGFGSSQHFARVFRKVAGTSPREFRRLAAGGGALRPAPSAPGSASGAALAGRG